MVARRSFFSRNRLKAILAIGDVSAIAVAYGATLVAMGYLDSHGFVRTGLITLAAAVLGLFVLRSQGLFLARISSVRLVELTRVTRVVMILGGLVLLADRVLKFDARIKHVAGCSIITLVLLVLWRSVYRSWLRHARAHGQYRRTIVIVGVDDEAQRLVNLVETHRELGITVGGVIGDRETALRYGLAGRWVGELSRAEEAIDRLEVTGVLFSPQAVSGPRLNELIRHVQRAQIHVFVATGFSGIDVKRVRAMPLAHEPMLYVEAPTLSRTQVLMKRVFDVVVASIAVVAASPILAVIAIAMKLEGRGPVFFMQTRVGQGGRHFVVFKFRTMAVDAEKQLHELQARNLREGPLFKMVGDPRVTRVGRFLRASSLDELPQLFNVLRGNMSLVGPRPALPSEVIHFSDALRTREQVLPGITGLWQVEARDNPSFDAYQRLDLFYTDNWSLTLDLLILIGTIEQTVARIVSTIFRRDADDALEARPLGHVELIPAEAWDQPA